VILEVDVRSGERLPDAVQVRMTIKRGRLVAREKRTSDAAGESVPQSGNNNETAITTANPSGVITRQTRVRM
jgi:hypothetical protein